MHFSEKRGDGGSLLTLNKVAGKEGTFFNKKALHLAKISIFKSHGHVVKASLVSLLSFSSAQANPPVAFDNFSGAGGGTINSACPGGFTCKVNVSDSGILQRELTDGSGTTYIQLIVTGTEAGTGAVVTTENFIKADGVTQDGISSKQSLSHNSGGDVLTQSTVINTGWANTSAPAIDINQTLNTTYQTVVGYDAIFNYQGTNDGAGNRIGEYVDSQQRLTNSSLITAFPTTGTDVHTSV